MSYESGSGAFVLHFSLTRLALGFLHFRKDTVQGFPGNRSPRNFWSVPRIHVPMICLCPLGFAIRVCICVSLSMSPWLRNLGVQSGVYVSMSPCFASQPMCASVRLYVYVPVALQPGCASVCVYVYVPLTSQLGCVCVHPYGYVPLASQSGWAFVCLYVYVPLTSQAGCASACLICLSHWLLNLGVHLRLHVYAPLLRNLVRVTLV